jgi:hypothetical protein
MSYSYKNPVYATIDNQSINCIIDHPVYGEIPYTAASHDVEPSCVEQYNYIIANQATIPIGPYVPPTPPTSNVATSNTAGTTKIS